MAVHWTALIVFVLFFGAVTILGFAAARWRKGDLDVLSEWGLAGGRFGTLVTWFLLGGDLYTAYTFIAVPAFAFGAGAIGFFAIPYAILAFPFVFVVFPRLWSVSRRHGYVTAADFVRGRFGSRSLALAVAVTGIVATMPYIALQLVGIEVVIAAMGVGTRGLVGELPLVIAFIGLAAFTYTSGLRAPAAIAIVKDVMVYVTAVAAIVVIPLQLGGFGRIFAAVPPAKLILPQPGPGTFGSYSAFATLAFGSGLALFLYPHAVTGVLSAASRRAVRRTSAMLPAYTLALMLIALLGFMALAAGVGKAAQFAPLFAQYGANGAVPALFLRAFPDWFTGFAFAAIGIGALVPAAIMSIAAANLFTRNIYRAYLRPDCPAGEEAQMAKWVSLVVKFGALLFVILLPQHYAIELQLLGGVWIVQTLPAVILGLYSRWLEPKALLLGLLAGIASGTWMAAALDFKSSTYPLAVGGFTMPGYAAVYSLILNLAVASALTMVFRGVGAADDKDETALADYR